MILLILFLAFTAYTYANIPKNPPPAETGNEDLGFPTAGAGRQIGIPVGRVIIEELNTGWYGDFRKEKVYAG